MEPYIGQIQAFGFNYAPQGWAQCNGQLLSITQNTALFSLLGTAFGGDGRTTFGLPDLQGRVPIGMGNGAGLSSYEIGEKGGAETCTLTPSQMPYHTHGVSVGSGGTPSATVNCNNSNGAQSAPNGNYPGASQAASRGGPPVDTPYASAANATMAAGMVALDVPLPTVQVQPAGSSQAFSLLQPYQAVNYSIALTGYFPPRP